MSKRKYFVGFKKEAVRQVVEGGRPVADMARRPGIHEMLLNNWKLLDSVNPGNSFLWKGRLKSHKEGTRRHFMADRPNNVWTGNITYVWTGEGWLYVVVVLDLFSRHIVGWTVGDRIDTALV